MTNQNLKLIYSKRVMEELVKRGFQPLGTLPNPKEEYKQFDSWVFVWSKELQKNLDEIKGR